MSTTVCVWPKSIELGMFLELDDELLWSVLDLLDTTCVPLNQRGQSDHGFQFEDVPDKFCLAIVPMKSKQVNTNFLQRQYELGFATALWRRLRHVIAFDFENSRLGFAVEEAAPRVLLRHPR